MYFVNYLLVSIFDYIFF